MPVMLLKVFRSRMGPAANVAMLMYGSAAFAMGFFMRGGDRTETSA